MKNESEDALRPVDFGGYIGQEEVKEVLNISIVAAKKRKEVLDHILIWGPPGHGKTTLARIIANQMDSPLRLYLGAYLKTPKDMVEPFRRLVKGGTIFIDEIHRMWTPAQEILYTPMEDGVLTQKLYGIPMEKKLQPFTLIGATTEPKSLEEALVSRFGIKLELVPYTLDEIGLIVENSSHKLGMRLREEAIETIAERSGGTPRVANAMLKRVRDYIQYWDISVPVSEEFVEEVLDKDGLKWKIS